ncbi:MAG: ATP-binding protein [Acidimicrobiales bacterium]
MTISSGPALDLRFRATIDAVPVARHSLGRWLSEMEIDRTVRDELALVVTELVTNAVEASPGPQHEVVLRATCDDDGIHLLIVDEGTGFEMDESPASPEPTAIRGRGIPIVRALMDVVSVERRDERTVVSARKILAD